MPSRRATIVVWTLFAAFLGAVVIASLEATAVRCEVCVEDAEGGDACVTAAGAERDDAVRAATAMACEHAYGTAEETGGPRVRPEIDETSRCTHGEPASITCEAG